MTSWQYTSRFGLSLQTSIGVIIAIAGNICIALALTLQKKAHLNLRKPQAQTPNNYGTLNHAEQTTRTDTHTPINPDINEESALLPLEAVPEEDGENNANAPEKDNESGQGDYLYLKSKLWWLGYVIMNIGEFGNFAAYSFAPASTVAPLGTVALIANCVFAPLWLGEHFRKTDLLGIGLSILGAVTVVLSTNGNSDVHLNPDALLLAISQMPFIIYSAVYIATGVCLGALSQTNLAKKWVFIDLGLCALLGAYTVLCTKAFSTLLKLEWAQLFTHWITYPVLFILVATGVGQIKYLNKALMNFDSKVVIPTQFVLFNISAIVGSAILYGDFATASFHQLATFCYGCLATFGGVFLITWSPGDNTDGVDEDDEEEENDEAGDNNENGSHVSPKTALILHTSAAPRLIRKRPSSLSLIGLSSAQHLLIARTPDLDRELSGSPATRRRTTSSVGANTPTRSFRARGNSLGRRNYFNGDSSISPPV